ncbi:hypothetical protein RB195_014371 [Necator americanus]|uniref:Uncharacterized protein n=1 Tax=Necator americanus TaxID=51031 RepID=A0ABR1E1E7_NECAM
MKVLLVLEQIHEQRERRNLLFLSLPLVVISQQYSTQRANVDTVPAWYQGHPKQMNPGYGYERVQGASQANMNYHNYPTFGANRPAYPELTMGGVAPTRRYPVGGQDPNAELLAAIKDVVAKFKASLDETGIDQDVRLMGSQLRNTWQQLRTGPMNEQLVTKDHNLSLGLLKTALCTEAFSTYDCTPYVFISLFCPML